MFFRSSIASHSLTSLCPRGKKNYYIYYHYFTLLYFTSTMGLTFERYEEDMNGNVSLKKKATQGPAWYQSPHGEAYYFHIFLRF